MSQPYAVTFGPWVPDGDEAELTMPYQYAPTTIPVADCLNVYWADQGYRSFPALQNYGTALSSQCLGAARGLAAGSSVLYAGNSSDLFYYTGSAWSNISKSAGAYTGTTRWSFAQLASCMIAANGVTVLQDLSIGSTPFADITGSPIGTTLGVIGQFLLVGNITSPTAYQYRLMWSGIGDPTNWPTPLTDAAVAAQSSYEDLTQDFGAISFIMGGPQQGVVFQQHGLTRLNYVGGDVVFQFAPYEWKRGLVAPNAAVQVGSLAYFLAQDGFHFTDGTQCVPFGAATNGSVGLNTWFWNNVNQNAMGAISAAWDATLKCVVFAIPTGSNTLPDTLLLYNPSDQMWTRAQVPVELIFPDLNGTAQRNVASAFDQTHKGGYFTGGPLSGYVETYDGSFLDGRVRDVTEVQPNILCTDTPTARVGYREAIQDAITYTTDNQQHPFSRRVTFDPAPAGRFIRVRVSSAAASALNGATLYTEMGGI